MRWRWKCVCYGPTGRVARGRGTRRGTSGTRNRHGGAMLPFGRITAFPSPSISGSFSSSVVS
eukprot:1658992-Prymnesium_polylepis.1